MAETADKILEHIESERARLQGSVAELEGRVRDVADIKKQFRENPILLPMSVIAGSFILSIFFWRR